ncbi:MAG TPA: mechanosensitive ion channel family protein [Candidatus Riflebacteria bacterium]|nr:mechanosensitive ion channel family protein [Candidatus Riflebacteria bacterium]
MKSRLIVVFFTLALLVTPIFAETVSESNVQNPEVITAEAVKLRFENPRDAVRTFMSTMNDVKSGRSENIIAALATLYLDEVPEESRHSRGPELADQLFKILNHFTFRIDAIPVEQSGRTYVLPVGKELGIEIALYRYDSGEWKFNYSKTLSRLAEYTELVESSQKKQQEDSTIDPVYFSARETRRLFLLAMNQSGGAGVAAAINTLDLSRVERTVRREIGAERVAMLKSVLDRYRYIDLVELPNDRQNPPVVLLNDSSGRIVIEKIKNADSSIESWKFSAQTVADLPQLYDAFKDKPLIEGVLSSVEVPLSVRIRDYMRQNFPALLQQSFLLENWQWLGLFCIVFLGLGFSRITTHVLQHIIRVLFRREEVIIDAETQDRFIKPISITATTLFWWLGLSLLGLPGDTRVVLLVSVKLISAMAGVWAGYRMMDVVGNFLQGKAEKTANKFDDLLVPLITRALKTMVIVFGLVFIADIFAVDIDKILAGLGLGGLAFALAAKDTISNIFGSLTVLIDRPFQIGDWVTIGSADGTVESVGVRSTRIRTFYNSLITIPNAELINAHIDNYGARQFRRITATIGIAYDTPPEKIDSFCEGIRELIRKHPYTRKDFYIVNLNDFAATSLGIMLYCFVKTPDWGTELREKHRLFSDIIRLAKALKVEFAFPTQTVYLRNEERPVHDNLPLNELAAISEGQQVASEIVYSSLGNPPATPPPVTF